MDKGTPTFLSTRAFALVLLKTAVVIFLVLTLLWFLNLRPPAPYMWWLLVLVWVVFFLTNLLVSLITWHYAYKGNFVFHAAFVVVAVGVAVSVAFRFTGAALIMEGDTFFGEETDYGYYESGFAYGGGVPKLSFKLDEVAPEYWKHELYFTGLEARIKYPAETLREEGSVFLNGGATIGGTRLRLTGYGFYPVLHVVSSGRVMLNGTLRVSVYPPGVEDEIQVGGYRVFMSVVTDPLVVGEGGGEGGGEGTVVNRSINITEPLLKVRVEWLGDVLFDGYLDTGEKVRFGNIVFTFKGLREFGSFAFVRDPGEAVVFGGFLLAVTGLALRLRWAPMGDGDGATAGGP